MIQQFLSTKKMKLYHWMTEQIVFSTADVLKWGVNNLYNSADKMKQKMVREGLIQRLDSSYLGYKTIQKYAYKAIREK